MRSANLHRVAMECKATPVTLRHLYHFGKASATDPAQRLRNAQFLHRELPIRISQRVLELETLPLGMTQTQPIRNLVSWFTDYFYMIHDHPFPQDDRGEESFTKVLTEVLQDPNRVVETICRGALEVKRTPSMEDSREVQIAIDSVLSRFYMARIGLRFLIEHHIQSREPRDGFAGIIQSQCSPIECIELAWQEASLICQHHLGEAPELDILQIARDGSRKRNHEPEGMADIHLTYVPGHLVYMLTEVLKNASRATVESAESRKTKGPLPPIRVIIVDGANDVTIRVSDEGGGITRKNMDRVWSYLHTTATNSPLLLMTPEATGGGDEGGSNMPALAGYGVGLPLSRLYARYFGGDLAIKSLEGFGTDVYLHVSRLGQDCENLPEIVERSPGQLTSMLSRGLSNNQA